MARFDFDLENALVELERVNSLLSIHQEFCDYECPDVKSKDVEHTERNKGQPIIRRMA